MFHRSLLLSSCSFLFAAMSAFATSPDLIDDDVQTLKSAGVGTDAAALIEFFRGKTLEDADRARIVALIRDLGANEFKVRESASNQLIKIGGKATSLLRNAKDG